MDAKHCVRRGASAAQPDIAYAAICLLCGRDLGHLLAGRLYIQPGSARMEHDGKRFRCGHCHGSIVLEPDPLFKPSIDAAELLAQLLREAKHPTRGRRRAG
jgi:hypothetical protein